MFGRFGHIPQTLSLCSATHLWWYSYLRDHPFLRSVDTTTSPFRLFSKAASPLDFLSILCHCHPYALVFLFHVLSLLGVVVSTLELFLHALTVPACSCAVGPKWSLDSFAHLSVAFAHFTRTTGQVRFSRASMGTTASFIWLICCHST